MSTCPTGLNVAMDISLGSFMSSGMEVFDSCILFIVDCICLAKSDILYVLSILEEKNIDRYGYPASDDHGIDDLVIGTPNDCSNSCKLISTTTNNRDL